MKIPIYIDGERAGWITGERRGAMTALEARLRDPGRLVRLWVYGAEGEAFYLGVPAPEEGQLRLVRRMTAGEMRGFPPRPRSAGESPPPGEEPAPRHILWYGGRAWYF